MPSNADNVVVEEVCNCYSRCIGYLDTPLHPVALPHSLRNIYVLYMASAAAAHTNQYELQQRMTYGKYNCLLILLICQTL